MLSPSSHSHLILVGMWIDAAAELLPVMRFSSLFVGQKLTGIVAEKTLANWINIDRIIHILIVFVVPNTLLATWASECGADLPPTILSVPRTNCDNRRQFLRGKWRTEIFLLDFSWYLYNSRPFLGGVNGTILQVGGEPSGRTEKFK